MLNDVLYTKSFYFKVFSEKQIIANVLKCSFEIVNTYTNIHGVAIKEKHGEYIRVNHKYYNNTDEKIITEFSKWFVGDFKDINENSITGNEINFFDELNLYEQVKLEKNIIRQLKIKDILS